MWRSLRVMYSLRQFSATLVYMLQSTEYQVGPYLKWYWRTQDFSKVMYRRTLVPTKAARLLRLALLAGMTLQILIGLLLIGLWKWRGLVAGELFGLALIVSYPLIWAHLVTLPLIAGRILIVHPKQRQQIKRSRNIFTNHPAVKIAVAGSYGKTSMKELLLTVLSEGKKVAATPANKNVASSHAVFAQRLKGDEDILIIEYGEGAPGDVLRFARTTQPTHGVITGLAPAHLDRYKTLERAGKDIFSLAGYLHNRNVYYNAESPALQPFVEHQPDLEPYSVQGCLGWRASQVEVLPSGTNFMLTKGKRRLQLRSGLLGKHQVGPLSLAVAVGLELGLTEKQVKTGIAKAVPFEHRMQPYQLAGGGWVIDDTYNGNIEGVRVGTALLKDMLAERKWYVTPGLVDQGKATRQVHQEMGELIAKAQPDIVVLMQNSVTSYIRQGLEAGKFKGEIRIEHQPLDFYSNLDQFIAAGDVVLMQNDWTDNYA